MSVLLVSWRETSLSLSHKSCVWNTEYSSENVNPAMDSTAVRFASDCRLKFGGNIAVFFLVFTHIRLVGGALFIRERHNKSQSEPTFNRNNNNKNARIDW